MKQEEDRQAGMTGFQKEQERLDILNGTQNSTTGVPKKVEEEKKTLGRQADFNTVACFTVLDPKNNGYLDFDALRVFMSRYDKDVNQCDVNAVLRRLNKDEDFKIDFREFASSINPTQQGFTQQGCVTRKTPLNIPTDPESDDPLKQSKFLSLLEHDGIAFNLEDKKNVLRKIETKKKTEIRGGNNDFSFGQNILRNFKQIYE